MVRCLVRRRVNFTFWNVVCQIEDNQKIGSITEIENKQNTKARTGIQSMWIKRSWTPDGKMEAENITGGCCACGSRNTIQLICITYM
jgi:hypothetical protein